MNTHKTIRLLIADVDGTLVTHDKVLTERARRGWKDALRRDRIRNHQRPATTRHADVDRAFGAYHAHCCFQWQHVYQIGAVSS